MSLLISGVTESMAYFVFLTDILKEIISHFLELLFLKEVNIKICLFGGRKVSGNYITTDHD